MNRVYLSLAICFITWLPAAAQERELKPIDGNSWFGTREAGVLDWVQYNETAKILRANGDLDEAEEAWLDSLDVARQLPKQVISLSNPSTKFTLEDPRMAESMSALGQLYASQKRLSEAEKYLTDAIYRKELIYGIDSKNLLTDLSSLQSVLSSLGKAKKAGLVARRVTAIETGTSPWISLIENAKISLGFGEAEQAEERFLKALQIASDFGDRHWTVAESHSNLGHFYVFRKQRSKAEEHLKQAISLKEDIYGTNSIKLLRDLRDYSQLVGSNGDAELSRSLKARSKNLDPKNYRLLPISSRWTESVEVID